MSRFSPKSEIEGLMVVQLTEKLDEEFGAMAEDINDALASAAKDDCWWESMNIFSHSMNPLRWRCF
jgi:hypothetical protein